MAPAQELPKTMKALVLESTSHPPTVQTVETPGPSIGSAVVRVLAASTLSYMRDIYNGKRKYPFPMPLIPGFSAIGRVAAVGPDATKLKPGDLVLIDCLIRSRDNPSDAYLASIVHGHTEGSQKLMRDVYRDWTFAEFCNAPLENLFVLDEGKLLGSPSQRGLGYKVEDLTFMSTLSVPYGGLRDIELQAGQTVVVAPATGPFGGCAVLVALAMGARVIAMGRNQQSLATLKTRVPFPERVETVAITGDMAADCTTLKSFGPIDAYLDIGPPEASGSTHIKSCILSLRHGARISLMGGYKDDIAIPHHFIMHANMRLYGKWMYERSDIVDLIRLIETGVLKLGEAGGSKIMGLYPLEQWKEAWDAAAEHAQLGEQVIIQP